MVTMKNIQKLCIILGGNTLYALAIAVFILPNNLITGGTTGLALIFQQLFDMPVTVFVAGFNIVMFIAGAVVLGKAFALTTIVSTFYYPFILGIFQQMFGGVSITDDMMLATVLGGILVGLGIGLVIQSGASTGGMDIPPLIMHKKWGLSVATMLLVCDGVILLAQMLFSNKEQILYGIVLVLIYTVILDKVLLRGRHQMQVKIISTEYEAISQAIQEKMDRGTTLLHVEGGHMRQESLAVLTVVSAREISKVSEVAMGIDPNAFMIMNQVNEVHGRGFTLHKEYK